MKLGRICSLGIAIGLAALMARADSLELKNGSRINGKFIGGTESEITFKVGSSLQKYDLADISLLKFDSETSAGEASAGMSSPRGNEAGTDYGMQPLASVTIPPGSRISVRMIDGIDSTKNHVGD